MQSICWHRFNHFCSVHEKRRRYFNQEYRCDIPQFTRNISLKGIWAYEPSICRSLGATYVKPDKYNGIPLLRYELDLANPVNHKDCFCRNKEEGECPPKGTFDLFKCAGSPMFGSHPHFYNADPKLLEKIDGLSPNKEEHGVFLLFEIVRTLPIIVNLRFLTVLILYSIPSHR